MRGAHLLLNHTLECAAKLQFQEPNVEFRSFHGIRNFDYPFCSRFHMPNILYLRPNNGSSSKFGRLILKELRKDETGVCISKTAIVTILGTIKGDLATEADSPRECARKACETLFAPVDFLCFKRCVFLLKNKFNPYSCLKPHFRLLRQGKTRAHNDPTPIAASHQSGAVEWSPEPPFC